MGGGGSMLHAIIITLIIGLGLVIKGDSNLHGIPVCLKT